MQVQCPQCGATCEARTETRFYRCPFCSSSFVSTGGKGVLQYCFNHERDDRSAWSALHAALEELGAGPVSEQRDISFAELPFWNLHLDSGEQRLIPAVRNPWLNQRTITLPGGDLCFIPPGKKLVPHEILQDEAASLLNRGEPVRRSMVYLPLYFLVFVSGEATCRAVVSGVDRKPYILDSPPMRETALSAAHISIIAGLAVVLLVEGFLFRNLLVRAVAFAVTLAAWYAASIPIVKREA